VSELSLVLHLSDLHLLANPKEQESIFDGLVSALRHVRERYPGGVDLLAVTGDVFDSATHARGLATTRFLELFSAMGRALGREPATVIIPGNHDRRRAGLFGPHRDELFRALKKALGDRAWVHGCTTPFLSALVPREVYKQPFWLVAYDSTYLPEGLLSAGGALRQEDLLYAAAQIDGASPDEPVLFLLHHHLVPTPITDLGPIEMDHAAPIVRWGVERVLPAIIAHGDREELTMTALGAGTALSTLHTLGRAVLVLHGHKHYATARLLGAMSRGHGDVLVVSAGSAGTAQRWMHADAQNAARLWPSFNVIDWGPSKLAIDTVSFPWKGEGTSSILVEPLVRAERFGSEWRIEKVPLSLVGDRTDLQLNASRILLKRSEAFGDSRWDYTCQRQVEADGERLLRYVETVDGLPDGRCRFGPFGAETPLPAEIHLDVRGFTEYFLQGALHRTLRAARQLFGMGGSPFASVSLMNRYSSLVARLEVAGLGEAAARAFASTTDLSTGLERPLRLERENGMVTAIHKDCQARTLLRVYWPFDASVVTRD
jgi:3',5'-cyclic AMP phosphodiesterase CpdA